MTYTTKHWTQAFSILSEAIPDRRYINIEEARKLLGFASKNTVIYYLKKMKKEGLVEHDEENNKWYIP